MKLLMVVCFILMATLCYCQNTDTGKNTITADSFLVLMEKKNSDFINKPFPYFSVSTNNTVCSNSTLKEK